MTSFRRGFKTQAEGLALELRQELGLDAHGRVSPWELAAHLGIEVASIADLGEGGGASREAIIHLTRVEPEVFSAGMVFRGTRALIIYNERHARTRTASSVGHEVSHVVLEHEPHAQVALGCRRWDGPQEAEADWLSGCILVPRPVAVRIAQLGTPISEAATAFGVSQDLMQMRLNVTGAIAQARRGMRLRSR